MNLLHPRQRSEEPQMPKVGEGGIGQGSKSISKKAFLTPCTASGVPLSFRLLAASHFGDELTPTLVG